MYIIQIVPPSIPPPPTPGLFIEGSLSIMIIIALLYGIYNIEKYYDRKDN
jgi:hypothetical protein